MSVLQNRNIHSVKTSIPYVTVLPTEKIELHAQLFYTI